MKKIVNLVKELEQEILLCVKCGTCLSVCPLYKVSLEETNVARGKLALLEGLINNLFTHPDEVNRLINKCLLCGACESKCPSNVNLIQIFLKTRVILAEYSKISLIKKIIFRELISKPERFDKLINLFEKFLFLFFKSNKNSQQTSSFRFAPLFRKKPIFKKIATTHFNKKSYALKNDIREAKYKIAFFPGCAIDKFYPKIANDIIETLQYHNIDIFIPDNIGCCGIPALSLGDAKTFVKLLDYNIDKFSSQQFNYLITPCATCLSTIKNLWPTFYKTKNKEKNDLLIDLSSKAIDISQFLINILKIPDILDRNISEYVTYHDPCHHCKILNIRNEPRSLIRASGVKLVEMDKADSCCGMGGTFNLFHYEESIKIGKLKGDSIIETNCNTIATSCPSCMMQLADIIDKYKINIAIKHPIEIYKEALIDN